MPECFLRAALVIGLLSLLGGACDTCDLAIVTDTLPAAVTGRPYTFELEEDCGGEFWFLVDGVLPPGISLTEEGELRGTPSRAGEYIFTLGLEDFGGAQVVKGFALTVLEPPPRPAA